MSGQIIDASIVATPKQSNTDGEKRDIKRGRIPLEWAKKPAKLAPLIGPSLTSEAAMRSWRSAAKNVSVRQRPCGTLATSRALRRQRPWLRVMLVLAQVSSINTRRRGSSRL
jgi:hypothetical protein